MIKAVAVQTARALAARRAEATGRGLELVEHPAPATTTGDPRLRESLGVNLVDDAVRHNQPSGRVEVVTGAGGPTITVQFRRTDPVTWASDRRFVKAVGQVGRHHGRMWVERGCAVLMVVTGVVIAANGVMVTIVPRRLGDTYGVVVADPSLAVLLRHRAVMLALIGLLVVAAAFVGSWRTPALICAAASTGSFVLYAFMTAGTNSANLRVAMTDFCYLDPGGGRDRGCRERMNQAGHRDEEALAEQAQHLMTTAHAQAWLDLAAGPPRPSTDARIHAALSRLRTEPRCGADRLATGAGLSTSHFLQVFRRETGTSFRRYRLWARMLTVASATMGGADLTSAAMTAGFASPSHFSSTFRTLFGLTPTRLMTAGIRLEVVE